MPGWKHKPFQMDTKNSKIFFEKMLCYAKFPQLYFKVATLKLLWGDKWNAKYVEIEFVQSVKGGNNWWGFKDPSSNKYFLHIQIQEKYLLLRIQIVLSKSLSACENNSINGDFIIKNIETKILNKFINQSTTVGFTGQSLKWRGL